MTTCDLEQLFYWVTAVKIIAMYDITTVNSCTNREVWQLKLKMFAMVTEGHRNWHQSTPLFCRPRNFLLLFHSHWVYSLCLDSFLWPPYGIGQAIIFLSCGFLYLSFFLAYSQPSQVGRLPYFHTWCGPSADLECRSEMCCMRLAGNTGTQKWRKKSPCRHHRTTLPQWRNRGGKGGGHWPRVQHVRGRKTSWPKYFMINENNDYRIEYDIVFWMRQK